MELFPLAKVLETHLVALPVSGQLGAGDISRHSVSVLKLSSCMNYLLDELLGNHLLISLFQVSCGREVQGGVLPGIVQGKARAIIVKIPVHRDGKIR